MSINEELAKFLKREFAKQTATLRGELSEILREEIKQSVLANETRISSCEIEISKIQSEILKIKRSAIKNNVIIFGLNLEDSNLVQSVISQINSLLGTEIAEREVNNIYRLGKKKSIVKVEFLSFLTKLKVVSNRRELRGTQVYINEDLCEEDRRDAELLRQQLSLAKSKNLKAYIKARCLYVNGDRYTVEELREEAKVELGQSDSPKGKVAELPTAAEHVINSAPNSPAPVGRYKQMLKEHDHLQIEEDSRISKEISNISQILDRARDLGELGRTRSHSSSSNKGTQKSGSYGNKPKTVK